MNTTKDESQVATLPTAAGTDNLRLKRDETEGRLLSSVRTFVNV
jgi:hypothetical protein